VARMRAASYYLKVLHDPPIDVPSWVALSASAVTFGGAAVGISYGVRAPH
jgi:hypothetical protein